MESQHLYSYLPLLPLLLLNFLIGLRTRLIDAVSTPDLLKMVELGSIDPHFLVSHSAFYTLLIRVPLIVVQISHLMKSTTPTRRLSYLPNVAP